MEGAGGYFVLALLGLILLSLGPDTIFGLPTFKFNPANMTTDFFDRSSCTLP